MNVWVAHWQALKCFLLLFVILGKQYLTCIEFEMLKIIFFYFAINVISSF